MSCEDGRVVCKGTEDCFSDCGLSAVYIVYNSGPNMLPWGTPESIRNGDEVSLLHVVTKYLFCRYDVRGLKYSGGGGKVCFASEEFLPCHRRHGRAESGN
jgi:hypothetical protein